MVADERKKLRRYKRVRGAALEAQAVVQGLAQGIQQKVHKQIANIVTKCLRTVGWDYDFAINFERKRGKTEARLVFLRRGHEVKPTDASGGGPLDVAAFALRVACLMLILPKRRRVLVLDEPFKNVHGKKYQQNMAKVVETLSSDLDIQFIVVTGCDWLKIGKVINLEGAK